MPDIKIKIPITVRKTAFRKANRFLWDRDFGFLAFLSCFSMRCWSCWRFLSSSLFFRWISCCSSVRYCLSEEDDPKQEDLREFGFFFGMVLVFSLQVLKFTLELTEQLLSRECNVGLTELSEIDDLLKNLSDDCKIALEGGFKKGGVDFFLCR